VANLELSDRAGGREERTVEVRYCDELQPAIAVILAVFAKNARVLPLDSSAQVLPAAAEQVGPNVTVPPSRYVSRTGQPPSVGLRRAAPSASNARELLLGSTFVGGVGWVKSPAIGPLLHLDWRPSKNVPLGLRVAAAQLTTLEFDEASAKVGAERLLGRIGVLLDTPLEPLSVLVGAEAGRVSAHSSNLANHGVDRALWFSLQVQPTLWLALLRRVLFLQLGTGVAFVPARYPFRYTDTQHLIVNTRRVEWRAELGLAVRLPSDIL
jgi:hypothetical protein